MITLVFVHLPDAIAGSEIEGSAIIDSDIESLIEVIEGSSGK
ncbi:hypothetical protein ACFL9T_13985 [Thermodesulfobacteriota bacterium]